jgi:hypothetical protein
MNKALQNLRAAAQKMQSSGSKDDFADKYWKLETDSAGNGYAIIRFLPGPTDDDLPFVKLYNHGFKGTSGRWFIENCPTTNGGTCPVCEENGTLWSSGVEKNKEIARSHKRKTSFISNILVVSDPKNPDNEGKVFMFRYGKKIFDKIMDMANPEFEDETPVNPFDPVEGCNFKIKQRKVEGFPNYDKSEFEKPAEIGTAKEIAKVIEQLHDLNAIIAADQFKSYDELTTKLALASNSVAKPRVAPVDSDEDDDQKFVQKVAESTKKPAPKVEDEDEDDLAYFQRLADE